MTVLIAFYERTPVTEDTFRYERINIAGPTGDTRMHTDHPPAVGDTIHLWDRSTERGGTFVVRERSWLHSSWGSTNWPYGEPESKVGPSLDLIVERAVGPFHDEAPRPEDEA